MLYVNMLLEVIKSTLTITCLVMVMLLLIEFINVRSSGKIMERLQKHPFKQVLVAALLGLVPGCLGGFAIVSLFTHKLISFGALVAGMITTFGDEAFVIFAYSPKWTLILSGSLIVVGIATGLITNLLFSKSKIKVEEHSFEIHDEHIHADSDESLLAFRNLRKISFSRALLLFGLVIYLAAILTGVFSHEHGALPNLAHEPAETCCEEQHQSHTCSDHQTTCTIEDHPADEMTHSHEHAHHHGIFSWENIIFIILALITLIIVALSPEHFLQSHLWEHVIKKHFLPVLLWTFGVLLFLHLLYHFVDVNALLEQYHWAMFIILLLAILLGIIPESGPHLIFVVMFFSGAIPFSVLLANSIVQDGHGALPLLAQSRKNFFLMKFINIIAGLIVGVAGYLIGF